MILRKVPQVLAGEHRGPGQAAASRSLHIMPEHGIPRLLPHDSDGWRGPHRARPNPLTVLAWKHGPGVWGSSDPGPREGERKSWVPRAESRAESPQVATTW